MKNDELIITSEGYFNNAHLGFSGLPQIHEGSVSTRLTVSEEAFEQFLERTNLTDSTKKYLMEAMHETETPFFEFPDAVCLNYLVNGDVTASMNIDANVDSVGVRLSDAEKERLKQVFDVTYSKEFPPLEHALFEASLGKEVPPLALEDCYHFEDWTPIDADNEEMLIRLSPSRADLENMVQRTPLWEQNYIQESLRGNDFEVYAYITHNNAVRAEIQPVHFIDGEKFPADNTVVLPLSSSEQRVILDVVDIELAKNNILFRLFDKGAEELGNLLCAKVDREYDRFITDMQGQTVDVAIESAYEIVWKDNINEYCQNEVPDFTPQQYIALLSSKNTLDDVYGRFLKNEYANSYSDLGIILEDTANMNAAETTIKGERCHIEDAWQREDTAYLIGQSVNTPSFYYACAMNASMSREYEYDSQPNREKVMSDHADKLAEEDIDRGEAIYGADGYLAFPDQENLDGEKTVFEKFFGKNAASVATIMESQNITLTIQKEDSGCYNIIGESNVAESSGDKSVYFHLPTEAFNENNGFSTENSLRVFIDEMIKMNDAPSHHGIDADKYVKANHQINYFINELNILEQTGNLSRWLSKEENISQGKKEAPKKSKCDMEH